jgi:hypothetical protein
MDSNIKEVWRTGLLDGLTWSGAQKMATLLVNWQKNITTVDYLSRYTQNLIRMLFHDAVESPKFHVMMYPNDVWAGVPYASKSLKIIDAPFPLEYQFDPTKMEDYILEHLNESFYDALDKEVFWYIPIDLRGGNPYNVSTFQPTSLPPEKILGITRFAVIGESQ